MWLKRCELIYASVHIFIIQLEKPQKTIQLATVFPPFVRLLVPNNREIILPISPLTVNLPAKPAPQAPHRHPPFIGGPRLGPRVVRPPPRWVTGAVCGRPQGRRVYTCHGN